MPSHWQQEIKQILKQEIKLMLIYGYLRLIAQKASWIREATEPS